MIGLKLDTAIARDGKLFSPELWWCSSRWGDRFARNPAPNGPDAERPQHLRGRQPLAEDGWAPAIWGP